MVCAFYVGKSPKKKKFFCCKPKEIHISDHFKVFVQCWNKMAELPCVECVSSGFSL